MDTKALESLVVEELIDKGFDLRRGHEAYAYCDQLLKSGRIRDLFQSYLDKLDWEKIDNSLQKILSKS